MRKPFFFALGVFLLGLGGIGILLPVMPTTCFVLGAAACFSRSSDRFYGLLTANLVFGPVIRQWEQTRSMPYRAKVVAIGSIGISGCISLVMVQSVYIGLAIVMLLMIPVGIILKITTTGSLEKVTLYIPHKA